MIGGLSVRRRRRDRPRLGRLASRYLYPQIHQGWSASFWYQPLLVVHESAGVDDPEPSQDRSPPFGGFASEGLAEPLPPCLRYPARMLPLPNDISSRDAFQCFADIRFRLPAGVRDIRYHELSLYASDQALGLGIVKLLAGLRVTPNPAPVLVRKIPLRSRFALALVPALPIAFDLFRLRIEFISYIDLILTFIARRRGRRISLHCESTLYGRCQAVGGVRAVLASVEVGRAVGRA